MNCDLYIILAIFLPWLAFFLRGRIFSAIFSFILWVILCFPMIDPTFVSDRSSILSAVLLGGLAGGLIQIDWFVSSFFLWVILTVWCCLVIHGDQRREEMEQLINTIKVDSGKSLHQETQQANEANKTWYLAIIFLIGLAVLAVFFIKREHQPSNNPNNSPKSGVKKLKNPNHKKPQKLKNSNNRSN
ncbi:flagellar biosynthesis protein FlgG [Helicobacter pylori]|uniref:flagellar biosynthesis protein FlgG n=1 Tax=Helicobacter pylori TaxID=210 RepID=UPI0030BA7AD8